MEKSKIAVCERITSKLSEVRDKALRLAKYLREYYWKNYGQDLLERKLNELRESTPKLVLDEYLRLLIPDSQGKFRVIHLLEIVNCRSTPRLYTKEINPEDLRPEDVIYAFKIVRSEASARLEPLIDDGAYRGLADVLNHMSFAGKVLSFIEKCETELDSQEKLGEYLWLIDEVGRYMNTILLLADEDYPDLDWLRWVSKRR